MLTYHPALDPYHTSLRMIRLIIRRDANSLSYDSLRILDFYFALPAFLFQLRFPTELRSWRKKVVRTANKYTSTGHPLLIFEQMQPAQDASARLLASKGIIEPTAFVNGQVIPTLEQIPSPLREIATTQNTLDDQKQLIEFLAVHLASIPLIGPDGLKSRSGLMEARYDAV